RRAYVVETPQLMCHAVPDFCRLQKELGGPLTLDSNDYYDKPWKVRQNESFSEITKWISPTRLIVKEQSQWQVRERDPSATLGQYGEAEKSEGTATNRPLFILSGLMPKASASFYLTTRVEF